MTYASAEAREELLDTLAVAIDEIGFALVSLSAAYEQLDEPTADKLEEQLFRPAQMAYGRAKRTHAEFAARHGLATRSFEQEESAGLPSTGAKGFIDNAVDAVAKADGALGGIQDSPELLEVGDAELRAGLSEIRTLVGDLRLRARELLRTLGR